MVNISREELQFVAEEVKPSAVRTNSHDRQKYFPLGEALSFTVTTSVPRKSSTAVTRTGLRSEVTFSQNAEELMKRGSGGNLKERGAAATGHQSAQTGFK